MGKQRRRLSPEDRRSELLALGAEVFGSRPYDEVYIDEIAERAGVSRALMYHYFPDKKSFFAAVVGAENQWLFELTNALAKPGQSLFDWIRAGVMVYVRYDETHPHGSWEPYLGMALWDPVLWDIENQERDRLADRILAAVEAATRSDLATGVRQLVRATAYSWLVFTIEFCRQRIIDDSLDADLVADACTHTLFDALGRLPGVPADLAQATVERSWSQVVGPVEDDS